MEQSREEPYHCSTLQLNDETRSQTETEWKMFSSPETRVSDSRDFSGFQEEVINPLKDRAKNLSARRRNLEQASEKILEAKKLLRRSAQLRESRRQERLLEQENRGESMERFIRKQENIETGVTNLFRPHTRSRGKVVEVQNVQEAILEYKGGRRQIKC